MLPCVVYRKFFKFFQILFSNQFLFFFHYNRPSKRKLLTNKKNSNKRQKVIEDPSDDPIDTGLSLMEDEELVLKMLDAS